MKKFILLTLLAFAASFVLPSFFETNEAKAQLVTTLIPIAANDTLTDTDSAWVYIATTTANAQTFSTSGSVADNISRAVTVRITKIDGTVAGSASLQGSNDGVNWETIGTALTLTNVADQVKTFDMRSSGSLIFKYYRAQFLSSGTNRQIPKVYFLRRSN
jgi:hypothetical protein